MVGPLSSFRVIRNEIRKRTTEKPSSSSLKNTEESVGSIEHDVLAPNEPMHEHTRDTPTVARDKFSWPHDGDLFANTKAFVKSALKSVKDYFVNKKSPQTSSRKEIPPENLRSLAKPIEPDTRSHGEKIISLERLIATTESQLIKMQNSPNLDRGLVADFEYKLKNLKKDLEETKKLAKSVSFNTSNEIIPGSPQEASPLAKRAVDCTPILHQALASISLALDNVDSIKNESPETFQVIIQETKEKLQDLDKQLNSLTPIEILQGKADPLFDQKNELEDHLKSAEQELTQASALRDFNEQAEASLTQLTNAASLMPQIDQAIESNSSLNALEDLLAHFSFASKESLDDRLETANVELEQLQSQMTTASSEEKPLLEERQALLENTISLIQAESTASLATQTALQPLQVKIQSLKEDDEKFENLLLEEQKAIAVENFTNKAPILKAIDTSLHQLVDQKEQLIRKINSEHLDQMTPVLDFLNSQINLLSAVSKELNFNVDAKLQTTANSLEQKKWLEEKQKSLTDLNEKILSTQSIISSQKDLKAELTKNELLQHTLSGGAVYLKEAHFKISTEIEVNKVLGDVLTDCQLIVEGGLEVVNQRKLSLDTSLSLPAFSTILDSSSPFSHLMAESRHNVQQLQNKLKKETPGTPSWHEQINHLAQAEEQLYTLSKNLNDLQNATKNLDFSKRTQGASQAVIQERELSLKRSRAPLQIADLISKSRRNLLQLQARVDAEIPNTPKWQEQRELLNQEKEKLNTLTIDQVELQKATKDLDFAKKTKASQAILQQHQFHLNQLIDRYSN